MEDKLIDHLRKQVKSKTVKRISLQYEGRDAALDSNFELRAENVTLEGRIANAHRIFPIFSLIYKVGWLLDNSAIRCMSCAVKFGVSTWKVSTENPYVLKSLNIRIYLCFIFSIIADCVGTYFVIIARKIQLK